MTREFRARNFATGSENRIHSDEVARQYGLRDGLVPGISIYGYMVTEETLQRGPIWVRFVKPVFDGDLLTIREDAENITASCGGEVCAVVTLGGASFEAPVIPDRPLPLPNERQEPRRDMAGTVLGTVRRQLEPDDASENIPSALLSLSNETLMRNFQLGPWMHIASHVNHRGPVQWGDPVDVFARIDDCFEKKGREFLVADVRIESAGRLLQWVRHTAIYRLR